ncbi:MAG: purine-nucleoside phosphorylase [candidate division Zixibacteria bacterium]|nr:purine-nucleoside phosphorylase [candidate division Zixibacteria bacterium]
MSKPNIKLRTMINEAVAFIRSQSDLRPEVGIILGTGLGALAKRIDRVATIPYDQIPHFPISTVETHAGRLILGKLEGRNVVGMQGRFHYYEGYPMEQVTFPVRVMKELGIAALVVCNASGGLNPQFAVSDMVLITDHINLQITNPLIGPNHDDLGPRFPDMYSCYDPDLIELTENIALQLGFKLHRGVYVAVVGPCLETPAEYRMLRILGGDIVGMSTVPEVIVARHQGTKVLGLSIITDMGLPDAMGPMNMEHIIAAAHKTEPMLTELVAKVVERMEL